MGYVSSASVGDTQINRFQRSIKRRKQLDEQEQQAFQDAEIPSTSRSLDEEPIIKNCSNEATQTDLTVESLTSQIMENFTFLNSRIYKL